MYFGFGENPNEFYWVGADLPWLKLPNDIFLLSFKNSNHLFSLLLFYSAD